MRPFPFIPAIIQSEFNAIYFLPRALPDVRDPQIAILQVKTKAPGIAQPPGVYLRTIHRAEARHALAVCRERIVDGNRIGRRAIDIHPYDGAENVVRILTILLRVAAAAAVAKSDIEIAARSERQVPTVMISKWLRHREHDEFRSGIRKTGIWIDREARDDGCQRTATRVGQKHLPIVLKVRMECHTEKPSFIRAGINPRINVQIYTARGHVNVMIKHPHNAPLLNNIPASVIAWRLHHGHRGGK